METGASFLALADESILVEILLRLPLRSICRFRCVSKEWDGLTKTSYFLDRHRLHSSRRLLLISSSSLAAGISNKKGVGIPLLADGETAVSSLSVPFLPNDARWGLKFVGSSNGLVCCVTLLKGRRIATVVWNPATDQFNYFPFGLEKRVENATYYFRLIVGFDFMHSISAYKLVTVHPYVNPINDPNQLTFQARVFNPNRNSWIVVEPELGLASCRGFNTHSITVNGVLYWLVENKTAEVALVSFSLHDEAFKDTWKPLPGEIRYLTKSILLKMQLVQWKNSVAVVGYLSAQEGDQFVMWVDTTTDQEINTCSWIQQIRIRQPSSLFYIGVWKDQLVCTKKGDEAGADNEPRNLFMYDPITQRLRKVHGERNVYFHSVVGYAESNVQLE